MAKDNRPPPDERSGRLPRRVPGAAGHSPGVFRRAHLPAPARHPDSEGGKAARPDQPPAGPSPPALDTLPRRVPGASPIQPPPPPGRPPPPDDDLTQPLAMTAADAAPADPAPADPSAQADPGPAAAAADAEPSGPPWAPAPWTPNPRSKARRVARPRATRGPPARPGPVGHRSVRPAASRHGSVQPRSVWTSRPGRTASPLRAWIRGHPPRLGPGRLAAASRIRTRIRGQPVRAGIRLYRTALRPGGTASLIGAWVCLVPPPAGTSRRRAAGRPCCPSRPIGTRRGASSGPRCADGAVVAAREPGADGGIRGQPGPRQRDNVADGCGPARYRARRCAARRAAIRRASAADTAATRRHTAAS